MALYIDYILSMATIEELKKVVSDTPHGERKTLTCKLLRFSKSIGKDTKLEEIQATIAHAKKRMNGKKPMYYTYGYLLQCDVADWFLDRYPHIFGKDHNKNLTYSAKQLCIASSTLKRWVHAQIKFKSYLLLDK